MTRLKILSVAALIIANIRCCFTMDQLSVKFEWKIMDFEYPSEESREEAIKNNEFIPENNVPMGIEVYKDRLFVTIARWKPGVASSLNYIRLNSMEKSPKLIPYPNWAAHRGQKPEIASPYRIRADRCGRLWVPDTGYGSYDINTSNATVLKEPSLIVYDLNTDDLLRRYTIPPDQKSKDTFLVSIAVDDTVCDDTYAYIADESQAALLVYSWKLGTSWRIKHHYFNIDPMATDFNILGLNFQWSDGLFGIALTAPGADNYTSLYFHPMDSFDEFAVSTKILRNKELADSSFNEFKHLGNRGPNSQSGASFIDKKRGVLFYTLINLNAVACWKTSNRVYAKESQGRVYMNNVTMVYASDIKVDYDDNLWVMSNRIHLFMYSKYNYDDVNFRIFTGPIEQAIKGTACDTKLDMDLINKFGMNVTAIKNPNNSANNNAGIHLVLFSTLFMLNFLWFRCNY